MEVRTRKDATERIRGHVQRLLEDSKELPRTLRKTQAGLAARLGIDKATISQALEGKSDFRLKYLDQIAEYFGVPPSTLIREPESALWELTPEEARLVLHWREWPIDVQERMLVLLDFFGGMLPEEKEQRRWWQKIQRIKNPRDREYLERTIDDVLRAQRIQPSVSGALAAHDSSGENKPATAARARRRKPV